MGKVADVLQELSTFLDLDSPASRWSLGRNCDDAEWVVSGLTSFPDFRSLQQDSISVTWKRVVPDFNRIEIWGIKLGWNLQGHGLTAANALLSFAQEVYTALLAVERSLVAHSPWLSSGMFRDTLHMGLSENSVPLHPMVLLIIIPIKWL